jgi:hypothetical protein
MKTHKARAKQKTTGKSGGGVRASGRTLKRTAGERAPVIEARYETNDALEDMMAALELLSSTQAS